MNSAALLADADFVLCDSQRSFRGVSVLIEDGVIAEIGERHALAHRARDIVDCRGLMLIPGLVNAHTHLFQIMTRGVGKHLPVREWAGKVTYPMAKALDEEAYHDAALLACADAIRNGATAVIDHPTHYARFHADTSMRAISSSGLRGAVARGGADYSLVDQGESKPLERDLAEAEAFVRRWGTAGMVQAWIGPSGFHTCTPHALAQFKALSRQLATRFHMHLAESRRGVDEAKAAGYAGETSQAAALGLLDSHTSVAHAIWVSEDELPMLASSGCQVVHCPTSNQLLGSGVAPVPAMIARGLVPALATDGPSSNDSLDMVAELKSAALLHRVMSVDPAITRAQDVFSWATERGARVLGCESIGRIAAGFAADIVGIRIAENPSLTPCEDPYASLVFCASGRDVALVMVAGRVLYRDGGFTTIDVERLCARVSERVLKR